MKTEAEALKQLQAWARASKAAVDEVGKLIRQLEERGISVHEGAPIDELHPYVQSHGERWICACGGAPDWLSRGKTVAAAVHAAAPRMNADVARQIRYVAKLRRLLAAANA